MNKFIILIMFMIFGCGVTAHAEDMNVTIKFNGKVYNRPIPDDYVKAVELIRSLERISNQLAESIGDLREGIYIVDSIIDTSSYKVEGLMKTINELTNRVDSLNNVILEKNEKLETDIGKKIDVIDRKLENTNPRPLFNFGGSVMYTMDLDKNKVHGLTLNPIFSVNKFYFGPSLGIAVNSDLSIPRVGGYFGFFFR